MLVLKSCVTYTNIERLWYGLSSSTKIYLVLLHIMEKDILICFQLQTCSFRRGTKKIWASVVFIILQKVVDKEWLRFVTFL